MPINVRIKNAQAIEDVAFQIKGFTCLVGKSNIGKSSVLRSIQSMFKNSGGLVRYEKDSCEVFYNDGDLDIHWTRGKENKYEINGTEYQTGREIPPPIINAGIKELIIGGSSTKQKIDVQTNGQHDPLFLLNKNKREAAEIISAVSRLDVISKASKECNRDLKQYKGKLKLRESDRDAIIQQLKKFENLEKLKSSFSSFLLALNEMQKEFSKLKELKQKLEKLKDLNKRKKLYDKIKLIEIPEFVLESCQSKIEKLKDINKKLSYIKEEIETLKKIKSIKIPTLEEVKYKRLLFLTGKLEEFKTLSRKSQLKEELKGIKLVSPDFLEDDAQQLKDFKEIKEQVEEINKNIEKTREEIDKLEKNLIKAKEAKAKIEKNLGSCPICGKEF